MLIRFKVSNFLSFKEETEFSMVAGEDEIHPNHIVKGKKNQPNLLRAALLYGANAAGKSNFVKAINFVKRLIVAPEYSFLFADNSRWFRLDEEYRNQPSSFSFEYLSKGKLYTYSFKILFANSKDVQIIEEKLSEAQNDKELLLFERKLSEGNINFTETNFLKKSDDKGFLKFVQRSTIQEELFLIHCLKNNVPWFQDATNWFIDSLQIVFPTSSTEQLEEKLQELSKQLEEQAHLHKHAVQRSRKAEDEVEKLHERLKSLESELMATDILKNGFKADKHKVNANF